MNEAKDLGGRPREYDREEVTQAICERLATGEPLAVICRDIGISVRTVNGWRAEDKEIAERFDEARDLGFDAIAADCLAIADTPELGVVEKLEPVKAEDGSVSLTVTERRNEDMLGHRKLRVETRLKLLAKWDPRRYGEKIDLNHGGQKGNPVQTVIATTDPVEAARIYMETMKGGN